MHKVLPGVEEMCAKDLLPESVFIREDLPTFERPIKANSGRVSFGLSAIEVQLATNFAWVIFI